MGGRPELGTEPRCKIQITIWTTSRHRMRGRSTGGEGGRVRKSRGAASVTLTLLPSQGAFLQLLLRVMLMVPVLVRTPMHLYWYSGEAAAFLELDPANITS